MPYKRPKPQMICPVCLGSGVMQAPKKTTKTCTRCKGSGSVDV